MTSGKGEKIGEGSILKENKINGFQPSQSSKEGSIMKQSEAWV